MANALVSFVVIYGAGCGSPAAGSPSPDLSPSEPPSAVDMAVDAAAPLPDLSPLPPDLSPPPPVDAPIEPPNFLGITSPGPLAIGAGFVQATRTLQPACLAGPTSFHPRATGSVGSAESNLNELGVAGMLAVGSGLELQKVTLYDALPSVKAFTHDAAADRKTDLSYLLRVVVADAGNLVFTDDAFTKIGDCGDHFAYQLILGARLIAGLKLHFTDAEAAGAFIAQYGSQLNSILQRDDLGWVSVALDHKATIVLQAAQVGGDPSKLKAILDASRCSIGNLPACSETMTQLIRYSSELQEDLGPIPQEGTTTVGGWVPFAGVLMSSEVLPGRVDVGNEGPDLRWVGSNHWGAP